MQRNALLTLDQSDLNIPIGTPMRDIYLKFALTNKDGSIAADAEFNWFDLDQEHVLFIEKHLLEGILAMNAKVTEELIEKTQMDIGRGLAHPLRT